MYSIYINDFLKKSSYILENYNTKINALEGIEDFINKFIFSKEGFKKINYLREPSSEKSFTWSYYNYGYVVTKNKDLIDSFTIYEKSKIIGFLINAYNVTKILTIGVIKIYDKRLICNYVIEKDPEIVKYFKENIEPYIIPNKNNN